jgi:hypothetical protein
LSDPEGEERPSADTFAGREDNQTEGASQTDPPKGRRRGRLRWRRRALLVFASVLAVTTSTSAGAFLGIRHERGHWAPLYGKVVTEVAQLKSDSEQLRRNSNQYQASSDQYRQSRDKYQAQLQDLQKNVLAAVGDLDHPSFALWNDCGAAGPFAGCSLTPGHEYIGGVPDTFTYYVSFRSTVPVTVWIMTSANFVCWETHYCAWRAVGWENRTRLDNGVFHAAEGCAGYFAVFFSNQAGTLYPDVRITRKPAAHPTGVSGRTSGGAFSGGTAKTSLHTGHSIVHSSMGRESTLLLDLRPPSKEVVLGPSESLHLLRHAVDRALPDRRELREVLARCLNYDLHPTMQR